MNYKYKKMLHDFTKPLTPIHENVEIISSGKTIVWYVKLEEFKNDNQSVFKVHYSFTNLRTQEVENLITDYFNDYLYAIKYYDELTKRLKGNE